MVRCKDCRFLDEFNPSGRGRKCRATGKTIVDEDRECPYFGKYGFG